MVDEVSVSRPRRYYGIYKWQGNAHRYPMMLLPKSVPVKGRPFVSTLGSFKTNSDMCRAGAKHGNQLRRERKLEKVARQPGQRLIVDYFKK